MKTIAIFLFTALISACAMASDAFTAGDRMVKTIDGVEYAFRWCPAGSFMMGGESFVNRAKPVHDVKITKGFWMLETEATQEMWKSIMGSNPSGFSPSGVHSDRVAGVDCDKLPVENVSWDDCQEFCEKLSAKAGITLTLPTEAQWEYACRAGTTTPYHFGSALNGDQANCNGNYSYGTSEVGKYLERTAVCGSYDPNNWGLMDMHGNVYEWCQDWYGKGYYAKSPTSDPTGPSTGSHRVYRGGSWLSNAGECRSADRFIYFPMVSHDYLGFRVLFVP